MMYALTEPPDVGNMIGIAAITNSIILETLATAIKLGKERKHKNWKGGTKTVNCSHMTGL